MSYPSFDKAAIPPEDYSCAAIVLTPTELSLVERFIELRDDKAIAFHMHRRPQTIHNHIASILHKLQVDSRIDLVIFRLTGQRPGRPDAGPPARPG
jgi:DNA-binding NarL/FixJ family response regulator